VGKNPIILVTGSTGMVGRSLIPALSVLGVEILAPTRKELDCENRAAVEKYFVEHKPVFVYHLAAKVGGISANIDDPTGFYFSNMQINLNVLSAAQKAGVKSLIYLGSSCMYPKDRELLKENDFLTGQLESTNEGYAFSKLAGMLHCKYMNQQYGLNYKVLVPSNLYGEHGTFDVNKSHLIPAVIRKVHEAKVSSSKSVEIWGDGTARREFMYVGDLVSALVKAYEDYNTLPFVMNLGLGHDYSVNEHYRVAAEVIGYRGEFTHDLNRPVGMKRKLVDATKAKTWGWEARVDISEGIRLVYKAALLEGALVDRAEEINHQK
jgi:GDP-L-fucose synthase